MRVSTSVVAALGLLLIGSGEVFAQVESRPAPALELTAGYAGFVDDETVDHVLVGGAVRFHLSPRLSVGPEIQFTRGSGADRDLLLTGNLTFDLLPPGRRVTPFVVAGGGLFRHTDTFSGQSFSSTEGAFTAGGGVRAWLSERVYAAAEFRLGWELHYRVTGTLGISLSR